MKKIIALALVLVMALSMTTVAFATVTFPGNNTFDGSKQDKGIVPSKEVKISLEEFLVAEAKDLKEKTGTQNVEDVPIGLSFNAVLGDKAKNYFTNEYFNLKITYDKGKDLVESVKFDDDGNVVIKFKSMPLESPKLPNFDIKELTIESKKKFTPYGSGLYEIPARYKFEVKNPAVVGPLHVGFVRQDIKDASVDLDAVGGSGIFEFDVANTKETATFEFGDVAYGEITVYDEDKYFAGYDTDVNLEIVKKYSDAELRFVNLMGQFNLNMALELYADEDEFVYEVKDGKVVPTTLKWDKEAYAWTGKVRILGSYVISDVELDVKAVDDTKNPNTGANDVVGVAVALAVVSLVAAGAVYLKK